MERVELNNTYEPNDLPRSIDEEHQAVRATVHWLRSFLERERALGTRSLDATSAGAVGSAELSEPRRVLRSFLGEFRDQLQAHFRKEEQEGGPIGPPEEDHADPGDAEIARRLRDDHVQLLLGLDELNSVLQAGVGSGPLPALDLERLEFLLALLERHEAEERAWFARTDPQGLRTKEREG